MIAPTAPGPDRRPACRFAAVLAGAFLLAAAPARAAEAPAPADLPVNRWAKLETDNRPGYTYSQPIYVPSRRQVLHWGAVRGGDYRPWMRNDVRAFDAARLRWASDYPSAEKLPGLKTHSSHGKGLTYVGSGEMLDCGTPAPSMIVNGVCFDSKRNQVIYTMKGLMAAYDPATKKWRDMKAKTLLYGKAHPGGPGVYGVGTCYDPVNDEIILFPHWGGQNTDMRDVTGRMSAHYGTFRYRFTDNTWRRVRRTFGSDEVRRAREQITALMGKLSDLLDEAWRLNRHPDATGQRTLADRLEALCGEAGKLVLPKAAAAAFAEAPPRMRAAAGRAAGGKMLAAVHCGSQALRALEAVLDSPLRVEPPPRCGASLVYDPRNKAIVLFGGHDGLVRTDLGPANRPRALNDTWLYDLTTRQWRELKCPRRPPPELWPKTVYDPASGLVLLVTRRRAQRRRTPARVTLWGLDVAQGAWAKLHEQPWTWQEGEVAFYTWPVFEVALDPRAGLLLLTRNGRENRRPYGDTFAFRLDADRLEAAPAPQWRPPPPIRPIEIPPDDGQWLARLKSLPANKWVHAKPPREAAPRGWGVAACDVVRGWVVYFGGGHASYQVNNVAVYVVGANRWVTTAGDHNDWVPPVGWGGVAMGYRGGRHVHHQRNEYVALDGRMFWSMGTGSRRWRAEQEKRQGPRYAWFHDIDRGGVWRQVRIDRVKLGEKVPGTYGRCCLVHPAGQVLGFGGALEPYDGRFFKGENYFSVYDIYRNTLAVRSIPPPQPGIVYECRPFCTLADRNQVFFFECVRRKDKIERQRTWVYDVEKNAFTDLKPKRQPPDEPGTVLYLQGQDAVWAAIGRDQQWVYSFRRNTWAPLPLQTDPPRARMQFDPVYTQVVYVAKYGVLVSVGSASRGTTVMRPDVRAVTWRP